MSGGDGGTQDAGSKGDRLCAAIQDAVSGAVAREGGMAISWVCVVEQMDDEGNHSIFDLSSDGMSQWARIGMLEFASRCHMPVPTWMADDDDED